ncbi:hypothetical protein [Rufibacter latericius]|uniref:Uncharacterized protein n=1 Tax=Rufibacter latericius TaxID=2487040 RepID=A0A3M9MAK7_9BACT|nr:hypothetical protein [Rufibacter latericius]RNI22610.1 hypothetical protein EFB08_21175 [Rufibacter latericius]
MQKAITTDIPKGILKEGKPFCWYCIGQTLPINNLIKHQLKIRIPLKFNLDEHLLKYPPEKGEIKNLDKDRLLYAVGLPITIRANNKDLRTWSGWVPVNAKTLMAVIGNGYKGSLDYFVRTGVLETANNQYIVGAQSTLYRHTEPYRGDYRLVELGRKFKAKLAKAKRKEMAELFTKPEYSKLQHLYDWFGKGKLELDIEAVREYLNNTLLKGKAKGKRPFPSA